MDISLFGEDGSDKWYSDEHIYSRIIVAGGGGGSASSSRPDLFGGYGGGEIGGPSGFSKIKGGTQTVIHTMGILLAFILVAAEDRDMCSTQ